MQKTQHLNSSIYFEIYRDILKHEKKGGPQYVVSAIFLLKIREGKIGTVNPHFFASDRRIDS
jgi:hypothetical protein